MSNKPVYIAYTVQGREGKKPFWTQVGAAFAHKNGEGFTLLLADNIAVSGKLVLMPPKNTEVPAPTGEAGEEDIPF